MSCDSIPVDIRLRIGDCPECIDAGNGFVYEFGRGEGRVRVVRVGCELSPENAEKKRVPPFLLGSPLRIGGVRATSFALGSAVTLALVAVAYVVRGSGITKITDSSAYGATTVT